MVPGEIVTEDAGYATQIDVAQDILKIAVVERHKNTHHIGIGYIKGYGLKSGAVATSISHDSHNIIAVGANEEDIAAAVNRVVELNGGIVVLKEGEVQRRGAAGDRGIMSRGAAGGGQREAGGRQGRGLYPGRQPGIDPFMTLSFMALPVIPTLRLTTRGVIDVIKQQYVGPHRQSKVTCVRDRPFAPDSPQMAVLSCAFVLCFGIGKGYAIANRSSHRVRCR